tara:strand:+ start:2875 stop:4083 length:1209 start_codon:yes stop_codon:yes gene_type:complete
LKKSDILFIHHCRHSGGASRSLLNYLNDIRERVNIYLLVPKGEIENTLKKLHLNFLAILGVSQFDNSEIGYYRGKRWLVLIRELFFTIFCLASLIKLKSKRFSAVHLNELSLISLVIFVRFIFSCLIIVHVRTVQRPKKNFRSRIISYLINNYVDQLICIDQTVLESLEVYEIKIPIKIVRNSLRKKEFNKTYIPYNSSDEITRVGMVSNFLIYKGIFDFYEAASILIKERKISNIEFHLFGDNFREMTSLKGRLMQIFGFQLDVKSKLIDKISSDSLSSKFFLRGYEGRLEKVYENLDILCFPSHLNAIGRPVIEASYFKIPSIVSLRHNKENDYIENDVSGIIIQEKNHIELANAIEDLHTNKEKRLNMGISAYSHIENLFSHKNNLNEFLEVFKSFKLV